jgi:nucleoid-associated protein YgaU
VLLVLALGVLLELLSRVPGAVGSGARRVGEVVTPRLVRRVVGVALGAVVAAGAAPGVAAATPAAVALAPAPPPDPSFAPPPNPGWAAPGTSSSASGAGWVPSAPVVRAQPDVRVLSPAPRVSATGNAPVEVVVRRGDSLWSIAARHLGTDASDAEIARAWPAWFEANRGVVGDDPDLLRPGQLLRAPDAVPS